MKLIVKLLCAVNAAENVISLDIIPHSLEETY